LSAAKLVGDFVVSVNSPALFALARPGAFRSPSVPAASGQITTSKLSNS
jgi:hypothetical protein